MLYDIQINSPSAINITYILSTSLALSQHLLSENILVDAQLADFLHYDVAKLN